MTRRLLLLTLALLLAAPATASAYYRTFRSPTGKIGCAFFRDKGVPAQVRCDWDGGGDHAVRVSVHGRGKVIDITDTVRDPKAKVLAYGDSTSYRGLKCTSRRTGMTCKSKKSGHGFRVNVEKQSVY